MKTKNKIWTGIACILGFSLMMGSCQKEELLVNDNSVSYISFSKDMTKDSTIVCFQFYPDQEGEDVKVAEVPIEVVVSGKLQDKDLEFSVSVDEKLSNYAISNCILPEKCVIKQGELKGTVLVKVKNSPELATTKKTLVLKVNEGGDVKEGIFYYSRAILSVTDQLTKPEWWDLKDLYGGKYSSIDWYYLGEYSKEKHKWLLEVLRENDDMLFDGQDKTKLRKYSLQLKYKVEEYNAAHPDKPLRDPETGELIEIPVVG